MFQQESDDFIAIKKSLIDRLLFGLLLLIGLVLFGSLYRIISIGFIPIMALHIVIALIHCLIYLGKKSHLITKRYGLLARYLCRD